MTHRRNLPLAWSTLQQREGLRRSLSLQAAVTGTTGNRAPPPEALIYSTQQSHNAGRAGNRYRDVLAYDRTAVKVDGEGYLNANVVADAAGRWWVAAQAPMPRTMYPFFRAIYTRAASADPTAATAPSPAEGGKRHAILVQLTGWEENGMAKADPYMPRAKSPKVFTEDGKSIKLELEAQKNEPERGSVYSTLTLSSPSDTTQGDMTLHHYYFDAWPDHGVPEGPAVEALKGLVGAVAALQEELGGPDQVEVWAHCSAGVGRTGTFLALLSFFQSSGEALSRDNSPLGPLPAEVAAEPAAVVVDGMRDWRGMLVQTEAQFLLLVKIVDQWKKEGLGAR